MKIKVKQQKKEFKNFALTLEFENEDEIKDLYNRLNISTNDLKKCLSYEYKEHNLVERDMLELFGILDEKLSNDY